MNKSVSLLEQLDWKSQLATGLTVTASVKDKTRLIVRGDLLCCQRYTRASSVC